MSVPVLTAASPVALPVDLTVAAAPLGWSGQLPDLINLIGRSLYGELDPSFLIGQSGGAMPTHDIGPWFSDTGASSGWFFFNPKTGSYSPLQQGLPVGGMVLWGGASNIPANWLLCDGSEVSRATFSGLFTAIGETWGAGDGESTFNLPPGGVFFINAAGFVADSRVPLTTLTQPDGSTTTNGQGVGAQGGSSLSAQVQTSDLPPMMVTLRAAFPNVKNFEGASGTSEIGYPNFQPQGTGSPDTFQDQPLADTAGHPLGTSQQPLVTLPPYCTINYIIKWQ
jgi:microcystin-dependent protein